MSSRSASRVVVTGIGAVSAWGWGVDKLREGLCSGRTAIRSFERFDSGPFATHLAGQVPDPPENLRTRLGQHNRGSYADRFAVFTALESVTMAGLPADCSDLDASVFCGSSTGGMFESEDFYASLRQAQRKRISVKEIASQDIAGPGNAVARALRATGRVRTDSAACSSAALAIGMALEALREGSTDIALAGGADSLCRVTYGGFNSLRSVDPGPCRPFRKDRAGLSLGEGGAMLVLERLDSALGRGATPLAELLGAGTSADAHHMTAPHPQGRGSALALERALKQAGRDANAVDFINAHGTGTTLNDASEYAAFDAVFGERAGRIPVCAAKASVGHLLGSAGAIEAVATILTLMHQEVYPTPGTGDVDSATPVNLVREPNDAGDVFDTGVSLNIAFGGCNGALVFGRWHQA
jgi:3-oxoacyl-[acyl-carrier-protein] synthase II